MYHCYEIAYIAYRTMDELEDAISRYPLKGGLCKEINADSLIWEETRQSFRLTTEKLPLKECSFEDYQFTMRASIVIGSFPNGNRNTITIYAS